MLSEKERSAVEVGLSSVSSNLKDCYREVEILGLSCVYSMYRTKT